MIKSLKNVLNKGTYNPVAIFVLLLIVIGAGILFWQFWPERANDISPEYYRETEEEVVEDRGREFIITEEKGHPTYALGDIKIKTYGLGIAGYPSNFSISYKGQEIDIKMSSAVYRPQAFTYKNILYVVVPVYQGGAYGPDLLYFYMLDKEDNFRFATELITHDYSKDRSFYTWKNNKFYIRRKDCYSYDRRNINKVCFNEYFRIEDERLIKRNEDFKDEYLMRARNLEDRLSEELDSHEWLLLVIEDTINYLLAGEDNKASDLYDRHSSMIDSLDPTLLQGYKSSEIKDSLWTWIKD